VSTPRVHTRRFYSSMDPFIEGHDCKWGEEKWGGGGSARKNDKEERKRINQHDVLQCWWVSGHLGVCVHAHAHATSSEAVSKRACKRVDARRTQK